MSHAWNACWEQSLRGSNPLSSAVKAPAEYGWGPFVARRDVGLVQTLASKFAYAQAQKWPIFALDHKHTSQRPYPHT